MKELPKHQLVGPRGIQSGQEELYLLDLFERGIRGYAEDRTMGEDASNPGIHLRPHAAKARLGLKKRLRFFAQSSFPITPRYSGCRCGLPFPDWIDAGLHRGALSLRRGPLRIAGHL